MLAVVFDEKTLRVLLVAHVRRGRVSLLALAGAVFVYVWAFECPLMCFHTTAP